VDRFSIMLQFMLC